MKKNELQPRTKTEVAIVPILSWGRGKGLGAGGGHHGLKPSLVISSFNIIAMY